MTVNLQIYCGGIVSSTFLGIATIADNGDEKEKSLQLDLFGKTKKEMAVQRPGKLYVTVTSNDELTEL